nr:RNA-directed DNA polymerase, eukaryota [Tanacetum cinerariifolium]
TWMANNSNLLFIFVYSPQELSLKRALWNYITKILNRWHREVIIMGDFNEARFALERHGTSFHSLNAAEFNMFIANFQLIDILLGGYSFTWSDKHTSKMSKLDRDGVSASNSMILFKNKLKFLKQILKEWGSIKRRNKDHDRKVIQDSLIEIDLRLDKGSCLPDDLTKRATLFHDLKDIDQKDSINLAQKAKIKWAIKRDENSKFFHEIVSKKRRHLAIKGILVDGEWIENPNRVKSEFYSYYSTLLLAPEWNRSLFEGLKVNVHKSSIYVVGICLANVHHMAKSFSCLGNNIPFTYLGVKVGANMMCLNSWSDVVKKMPNKIST